MSPVSVPSWLFMTKHLSHVPEMDALTKEDALKYPRVLKELYHLMT